MPLVNENKAKNSGQETHEISKQDEHEQKHGEQETTKIHEEGDKEETTQKKEDKPDQLKPIVDDVDKKGEQKQGYEMDKHGQQTTQIHKGDKLKVTEHKPDEQPKTTEQKPDNQPKAKKQKREDAYNFVPFNSRKRSRKRATSKHDIEFQGDVYIFVPSPRHKYDPLCYACGKHIKFSLYHCEDKERYLHPFCCKLNPMIRDLKQSYILVESSAIICKWCKIKDDKGELSYVSTTKKDLRFHVYCFMELIKDKNNDNHVVKGWKTEAFLELTLSLTNIAIDGLTGGSIYSMFSFMIVP